MTDYISREAAIAETRKPRLTDAELRRRLANIPAADVRPVVRARWGLNKPPRDLRPCCSFCGDLNPVKTNFCPNCGADMREPPKEAE